MFIYRLLALLVALAWSTAQSQKVHGAYLPGNVTQDEIDMLVKAAGNASLYNEDVTALICLIAFQQLERQSIDGTNYNFLVGGCPVKSEDQLGACTDRNCTYSDYHIVIYSQPRTHTLKVKSIRPAH
ncbi:hypothetical protein PsorP6_012418 [Peronosclerospora sorghi]|uniref:Uncharacterized protein n=1 Tax=Peronosclerospora sorghi TaxID=230839 RepID=A0ACC0WGP8_9STRA|nr:hypothetical protein PsorP6_012418 [Peronosclerospora sorghi]